MLSVIVNVQFRSGQPAQPSAPLAWAVPDLPLGTAVRQRVSP